MNPELKGERNCAGEKWQTSSRFWLISSFDENKTMKRRLFKRKFLSCQLKKIAVLVLLFMGILAGETLGQIVIDNPDKPKSKNAGRAVMLEEVIRIKDDGKEIIFRNPQRFSLSEDGSIFFLDEPHIYKYSKDGQFIFKALKEGEGPGECKLGPCFFLTPKRIRVQVWIPPKVMDYDLDGRYIKEIKTKNITGPFWFLWYVEDKIYGIRDEIHFSRDLIMKEGLIETFYTLYEISEDFKQLKKLYDFPVRHYIKKGRWLRRDMVDAVVYDHYLFMVHTAEYKIVKFDLQRAQIERIFMRKYHRRKSSQEKEEIEDREAKGLTPPAFEYYFDISAILVFRDSLWVITSTSKDNDTKRLVDVFDMEGRYIDSFYLQFPLNNETHWIGSSILSDDGFLFIPEQSEDGFVSIAKYRIKDNF
jgi:hypothetical protein